MALRESQKFTQKLIWGLLAFVVLMDLFAKYKTYFLKESFGNVSPTDSLVAGYDLIIVGVVLLFIVARLVTEVDENEIRIKFFPIIFWWKRYPWTDIESVTVVEYDSLDEFWGWGIRYNFETWAYNVKGNHGIRIKLKDGEQVLIGTQKPEEFRAFLKEEKTTHNTNHQNRGSK